MKRIISVLVSIILLLNMALAYTTQITVGGACLITTSEEGNSIEIIPKIEIDRWDILTENTTVTDNEFTMPGEDVEIEGVILDYSVEPLMLAGEDVWYTQGTDIAKSSITNIEIKDSYEPATTPVDLWYASSGLDGTVMAYIENNNGGYKLTIAGNGTGKIYANTNSSEAFWGVENVTEITGFKDNEGNVVFDTSNVTNMNRMFFDCSSLTSLNINGFDTSKVTDMHGMFYNCSNLTSLNLNNFNTSKVSDMQYMFESCSRITELNIGNFNTSNVSNMNGMFYNCNNLQSLTLGSNFITTNVTSMKSMFCNCNNLISLDLSNFNTSNVTDMSNMFANCHVLTNISVNGFDTSKVTDMGWMFKGCTQLTSLNISNFDTRAIAFSGTATPEGAPVGTGLSGFASECPALTEVTLGENFGQSNNMPVAGDIITGMFYASSSVNTAVIRANTVMTNYGWNSDNRTVTFQN